MRRSLLASALALLAPALASAQDDADQLLGGALGELRAVLDLNPEQRDKVRTLYRAVSDRLDELRKLAKSKGVESAREEYRKLQADAIEDMKKHLSGRQLEAYARLLGRKRELAGEFEKALLGIPPVTEIRLKLGLPAEECAAMQKAADDAVRRIRDRIAELKEKKQSPEQITAAVNEIRREGIGDMIAAASPPSQKRLKDYIRWYLGDLEAKLARQDLDRLNRVTGALRVEDEALRKDARHRVAAVLMHRAEVAWGVKSLVREVMLLIVGQKTERDIWEKLADYGTLNDLHRRRLDDLQRDLKQILGGKDIGKLVGEGVIEE